MINVGLRLATRRRLAVKSTSMIEKEDDDMKDKANVFVEHIEKHLKEIYLLKQYPEGAKVSCRICGKTIDEIYVEEAKSET